MLKRYSKPVGVGTGTLRYFSNVILIGNTRIEKNCRIRKFSTIENSTLEQDVEILPNTIIRDSHICKNAKVGPFAHVRNNSTIEQDAVIGNFVEVKKTVVGKNSSARHLSYLGDTIIGTQVNIGAGVITCNYDGFKKHQTIIKNNAYIGSNNTIIAPVTIGQNAFTAAGSTITQDVPDNSLAIGRAKQVNKEGYVQKLLDKLQARSTAINSKNNTQTQDHENNTETETIYSQDTQQEL